MQDGSEKHPDPDRWIRWPVYGTAAVVAAFAFVVSYSHIYDLGRGHAQSGVAGRLLPLSVDLLIVASSLVLLLQSGAPRADAWLARWLPRIVLWTGIGATVAANLAYGLPHGWLAAVISAWPGAAFVGVVEMVMIAVRPGAERPGGEPAAGRVPSSVLEAAEVSMAATVAAGNPLSVNQLAERFKLTRALATKVRQGAMVSPAPAVAPSNRTHGAGAGALDAAGTRTLAPEGEPVPAALNGDGGR